MAISGARSGVHRRMASRFTTGVLSSTTDSISWGSSYSSSASGAMATAACTRASSWFLVSFGISSGAGPATSANACSAGVAPSGSPGTQSENTSSRALSDDQDGAAGVLDPERYTSSSSFERSDMSALSAWIRLDLSTFRPC